MLLFNLHIEAPLYASKNLVSTSLPTFQDLGYLSVHDYALTNWPISTKLVVIVSSHASSLGLQLALGLQLLGLIMLLSPFFFNKSKITCFLGSHQLCLKLLWAFLHPNRVQFLCQYYFSIFFFLFSDMANYYSLVLVVRVRVFMQFFSFLLLSY